MTCGAFHSTKLSTFAFRKPNSSKTLRWATESACKDSLGIILTYFKYTRTD
jgi:hypothetical protein